MIAQPSISNRTTRSSSRVIRGAAVFVLAGALFACTPMVETRGNLPDPELLADIEVGQVNRGDVEDALGSPSSISTYGGESWYYVSERTETLAFLEPKVVERKVVIIRFDKKGVVNEVKTLGLDAAREIETVERVTPTAGQELTFLRQLFGNLGRFDGAVGK